LVTGVTRTKGGKAEAGGKLEHLAAPLVAIGGRVLPDLLRLLAREERTVLLGEALRESCLLRDASVSRSMSLCAARLVVLLLVTAPAFIPWWVSPSTKCHTTRLSALLPGLKMLFSPGEKRQRTC
jgi:hypothetical protein